MLGLDLCGDAHGAHRRSKRRCGQRVWSAGLRVPFAAMAKHLLAIDQGTTGSTAIVVTLEGQTAAPLTDCATGRHFALRRRRAMVALEP